MKKNYILICLLASISFANAQYQNFDLNTTNDDAESKTYIGRDYVRLQNGYSFSATKSGKTLNAKVQSGLTPAAATNFLAVANPTNSPTITPEILTAINTGMAVGQIPISSSVNPNGAKCYNVPIEIVPGRQGFQPNISLSYNSQAGNGVVGMGWNISGLSSIERVNKNMFYDGINSNLDLEGDIKNGVFELDGVRLILKSFQQTSSITWIANYETIQGNIIVTANIDIYYNINFTVKYPNGSVGNFGFNPQVKTSASANLSYPITKLTNINGSTITFSYDRDDFGQNDANYIKEINYGECNILPNFAKIKFSYEVRPDHIISLEDTRSCYYNKRLIKIECFANPDLIRTYKLDYSNIDHRFTSNQNDVSRLIQINSFVNSGIDAIDNLNPLKFYYGENIRPSIKEKEMSFIGANFNLSQVNAIRGKFDVNIQNEALIVFAKKEVYNKAIDNTYTINYLNNEQIKVYQNIKDSTSTPCRIALTDGSDVEFTTGDGFEDVFAANVDGKGQDEIVKVNMRLVDTYMDFEHITFNVYGVNNNKKIQLLNSFDYQLGNLIYSGEGYSITPLKYLTGNFTGSGKTEVLALSKDNNIRDIAQIITLDGSASNSFTQTNFIQSLVPENLYPMDIDGDGQTEVVYVMEDKTVIYKYIAGVGFDLFSTWNDLKKPDFDSQTGRQIMFADLNGDGNIDIIRSPKIQEPKIITHPKIYAPNWFNNLDVESPWIKCDKCGYVQHGVYRNANNIVCQKRIGVLRIGDQTIIKDYYPGEAPINDINIDLIDTYPKLNNNNSEAQYLCPGCNHNFYRELFEWDANHCWACNEDDPDHSHPLIFGDLCFTHGTNVDLSNWSYQPEPTIGPVPITHDDWIYQYTNGRYVIRTETIAGIGRTNDHKYSIHEINGDETPDLIIQTANNHLKIYPFDLNTRSFKNEYLNTTYFSQGYELLDFELNSNQNYSSLLALGSNKLVTLEFPYNHTRSNMISLMVNSLGVTDKNEYNLLTQGTNYSIGNSAIFPYTDFSGTFWVTTQTNSMYNNLIINNAKYSYGGAIMHNQGLGLLGFSSMVSTDLMTNKVVTTEFDPIHMGAVTKQTSDEEESTFTYDYSTWTKIKMKLLLTGKTVTDKLKGNTVSSIFSDFDEYGNTKMEVTSFSGDIINKSIVENTWDNKVTGSIYLIGMPTNKKITMVRDNKTFIQNNGYEYFDVANKYRLQFIRKSIYKNTLTKVPITDIEYKYNTDFGTLSDEIVHNRITNNSSDDLTTSYIYWDVDKCSLWKKTDPFGLTTTYNYKFNTRQLDNVVDYKGNTITYGYNNWGEMTNEVSKYSTGTTYSTTAIDLNWNTSETEPKRLIKEIRTTTKQPTIRTYFDALGRETRKSIDGFDDKEVFTDNEYDNFGRLKSSSVPYKQDESPLFTTYDYDRYNRSTKVMQPNGGITVYTYSGNEVTENKDGIITSSITDATGKLISSKDNGGEVKYTYRPDGQADKINTAGIETGFDYDDYCRQTKLIDPSAGTIQTAYDDANHKVTQTWNSGKFITTVTNKFGQQITKITPDFTSTYTYENSEPKSVSSTNGTSKNIDYDTYGRLWKITETVNDKTYQEVYEYDDSRIGNVTYNTGSGATLANLATVVYKYKTNGYLCRLEDNMGNRITETIRVNALGQETSVLLGNGLSTTKSYTPEGLWTNVTTSNNSTTIQNMNYDFNRINSTLNSRTDIANNRSTEYYSYDNLYRLKNYGTKSMDYSPNGNILNKTDVGTYAYPDPSKPYTLTSVNTSSQLINQLNVNYTVMSRPTSINNATGLTATFTYNDDYDRASMQIKQGTSETMNKTYFGGGKFEIETVGGIEKQRLYVDGSPYTATVLLEKVGSNTQQYFLHRDYLGSITQITDNNANLAAEYSYDAWGRMLNPSNGQVYALGTNPTMLYGGRGYTGHEQLNQFGLINMNARLYDPLLGRFLAPDPYVSSGLSNDFNRYVYCRNNPLMFTDPSGEHPTDKGPGGYFGGGNNTGNYSTYYNWSNQNQGLAGGFVGYGNVNSAGGYTNYNNAFAGGYGGGNSGEGNYGALVFGILNYLVNPSSRLDPSRFSATPIGTPTPYSGTAAKPLTLAKPVGSGASTVYAGGGKRLRGSMSAFSVGVGAMVGLLNHLNNENVRRIYAIETAEQDNNYNFFYRSNKMDVLMRLGAEYIDDGGVSGKTIVINSHGGNNIINAPTESGKMTAKELHDYLLDNNKLYQRSVYHGETIIVRIEACNTGNGFAQTFSSYNHHMLVYAPNAKIQFNSGFNYVVHPGKYLEFWRGK